MSLADVRNTEQRLRVVRFEGGRGMRMKLLSLGLDEGDIVRIIAGANRSYGPVMLENITKGTKIAVGRGIAQKIIVEIVNE